MMTFLHWLSCQAAVTPAHRHAVAIEGLIQRALRVKCHPHPLMCTLDFGVALCVDVRRPARMALQTYSSPSGIRQIMSPVVSGLLCWHSGESGTVSRCGRSKHWRSCWHGASWTAREVLDDNIALDYRPTDLNWSKALWYSGQVDMWTEPDELSFSQVEL